MKTEKRRLSMSMWMDGGYIPNEHKGKERCTKGNVGISWAISLSDCGLGGNPPIVHHESRATQKKKRGIHDWKNVKRKGISQNGRPRGPGVSIVHQEHHFIPMHIIVRLETGP
jgi:hypothetical protein